MFLNPRTLLALRKKLFSRRTFQSRLREIIARNRYHPYMEGLEERRVLATLLVTNVNDSGVGSFRQAIVDSNSSIGIADTIQFSIGSGLQTIAPTSQLPPILDIVTIDATTQPGFVGTPLIELRGDSAGAGSSGFVISAPNTTIRGFTVNRFGQNGVLVQGTLATGNTIAGNWIGTTSDGLTQAGNQIGVAITFGASGNFIGGTTATPGTGAGNIISGNTVIGVQLEVTDSNQVSGNVIGLDRFGNLPVGNVFAGVYLVGVTTGNIIGGATVAHRNIISGNQDGIDFAFSGASSNSILNNYVGTNLNGTLARPNTSLGVFVVSANNTIGAPGAGNLISGNAGDGISVLGSSNLIQANYIGVNSGGVSAIANVGYGIRLSGGATGNTVGGGSIGAGNVVSGSSLASGVILTGAGTSNNKVQGNLIGTNGTGTSAIPNLTGILVYSNAQGNILGVDGDGLNDSGEANVISGNTTGVYLEDNVDNTVIAGNRIGTNLAGNIAIPNSDLGIRVFNASVDGVRIGTNSDGISDTLERNIISGNTTAGIEVRGTGTVIAGNYIGIGADGSTVVGTQAGGITFNTTATASRVGSNADGFNDDAERNVISGNTNYGVSMAGVATSGNTVAGNYIGTRASGLVSVANGIGIQIVSGASNNVIGGTVASARNILSGNTGDGVFISGIGTTGNTVIGNYIGTDKTGAAPIGNNVGVDIRFGATGNRVGGATIGERNVISGNVNGVAIVDSGTTANRVSGNYIGTDWTGTSALGNSSFGVLLYAGASVNIVGTNGDGTTDSTEGNVISGNTTGVFIQNEADNNVIAGNYVGTNETGSAAIGNAIQGIRIFDNTVDGTRIGTNGDGVSDAAERNVVSANGTYGIFDGGGVGTIVAGNYVGTDATGASALGGQSNGIVLVGTNARVGTNADGSNDTAERNVVSGHGSIGVELSSATGTIVAGNYIGTNATGTAAIANVTGVLIVNGANNNTIGGSTAASRNVISGNTSDGVRVEGAGTTSNSIAGNYIGVNSTGNTKLANGGYGVILVTSGVTNNIIGGLTGTVGNPQPGAGLGNVISGNSGYQIFLAAHGQTVQGNMIGLGADGSTVIDVATVGIGDGSVNNSLIGGLDVRARNVISGLAVSLNLSSGSGTRILNNYIGTDVTGSQGRGSGPSYLYGASNLTIGAAGAGNVWSASSSYPISGFGSDWTIQGNRFGTTADGSAPLLNTYFWNLYSLTNFVLGGTGLGEGNQIADQINIADSTGGTVKGNSFGLNAAGTAVLAGSAAELSLYRSSGFIVGGSAASARNVFASVGFSGVDINGFGADGNIIRGNYFGTNAAGTSTLGSFQSSIYVSGSAANNTIDGNVIASGSTAGVYIDGGNSSRINDIPNFAAAWFKAEGSLANSAGYSQGGTSVGSIAFGSGVAGGQAFQFNRSIPGYVKSEHIASYTHDANNASIESWINPTTLPTAGQEYYISSNGDASNPNTAALLINTGGSTRLAFRYRTSTGSQTATSPAVSFGTGSFHHMAVTANGTNVKFYVDGSLFSTVAVVGSPQTFNNFVAGDPSITLYVGGSLGATNRTFDGKIDELAVYNRALTAAEVSRIFAIGGADKGGNWTRNTTVTGNIIGLLADGITAGAITGDGIKIDNSESNTIGGSTAASRNIIGKAGGDGVKLENAYARFNVVASNYIGTDVSGLVARGNIYGVSIALGAISNTIGGSSAAERNVISGNIGSAVILTGGTTTGNVLLGNYIGLGSDGSTPLGNEGFSVFLNGAPNNTIGGMAPGEGNIISATTNLVVSTGSGIQLYPGANNTRILGNRIGTDATGNLARPNRNGIVIPAGVSATEIRGNQISSNTVGGIDTQSPNSVIAGNFFGTNASGTSALGSGQFGVVVNATNVRIGGSVAADRNIISGHNEFGIAIQYTSTGVQVQGNYIGTDVTGNAAIANGSGVIIAAGPQGNTIGGTTPAERNVISGNVGAGVWITGPGTNANAILGNYIGSSATGTATLANAIGIQIDSGASNNTIGSSAGPNVIGNSTATGIRVGLASTGNTINSNLIGVDALGVPIPNVNGIRVLATSGSNSFVDNQVRYSTGDNILIEAVGNPLQRNVSTDMGGLPIRLNPSSLSPGTVTITQVVSGTNALVVGEVQARPTTTYIVELFSSPSTGQASRYVQSATVTTDASGFATFSIAPPAGQMNGYVHATLTGQGISGATSTSQLSNGILATPAIILGLRSQSPEGTPITLTAFASSNPVTGYLWEVKKDGIPYAFELRTDGTQSDGGIQFTPDDEGVFTVSLRVTLADGTQSQLGPYAINVYNVAPTPSFNYTPSIINAGTVVTLTSNNSDPGQLDILKNSWEVRSGSPTGAVVYSAPLSITTSASFTPAAGGFYYASMTVDDGDGGVRSLTREIAVNGLPASTTIVVPDTSVREGQTVRARAPEAELNRTEQLTFVWTVFKTPVVGPTVPYPFTIPSLGVVEFVPNDDGVYTIGLTITSGTSSVVAAPQQVVVGNVSPRIQITGAPNSPAVGTPINLGSSITDPGIADTHTVTWSVMRDNQTFGTTTNGNSFSFTPNVAGVYSVTATATDDDGGVGTTRRVFNLSVAKTPATPLTPATPAVPPVPPTPRVPDVPMVLPGYVAVTILPPNGPYYENTSYTFGASVPAGVVSYIWRARSAAGSLYSGSNPTFSFTPQQGGDHLVELSVTLSDGRVGTAFFSPMSVLGAAPVVSPIGVVDPSTGQIYVSTPTIYEGTPVTVRALATDSREKVGLNYQWELKKPGETAFAIISGVDGAPADFRFLPTDNGPYVVRVSVSDSQGLTTQQSLTVSITNADPLVRLESIFNTVANVRFRAIASDPGIDDTPDLRYAWSVNGGSFSTPSTVNEFEPSITGLTQLSVRVTDDDGGVTLRSFFVLKGTNNDDTFTITASNTAGAGVDDQVLFLALDGNDTITIDASVTKKVVVLGGKGNDIIDASAATAAVLLDGGEGNDTLTGGSADDVLIAGPGTNVLYGGNGNNRFIGGGSDTMVGGANADYYEVHFSTVVLQDPGGIDTIDLTGAQSGVTLNVSDYTGVPQTVFAGSTLALTGLFENLIGSQYGDVLTTNSSGTTIDGGGGDDRLVSGASGTKLSGGDGNDTVVLNNAAGTFDGGTGNDTVSGTLLNNSPTSIATGAGDDIVDVLGATTGLLSNVDISLGGGVNTLTASRIKGNLYGNNGANGVIDVFGSASPATSTITVSNSNDIDIFGSASPGSSITVTSGANIDIFGSGALSLTGVIGGRITSSIFGSASTAPMVATVSSSTNIDIFGSASPTGPGLTASVSGGSSNIDIFGSASPGVSTVTVTGGSNNIDIFGSASPTGSPLNATISGSSYIDIFGSASTGVTVVTVNGGSTGIDIFGSASPSGSGLTATISNSSNVDIFGSASTTGATTVTVSGGSTDIDIFGSASPTSGSLTATISNSSIVDIFGSASTTGVTTVTVSGGSTDIDIFGSASPASGSLTATISNSSNVDIFGSASPTSSGLDITVTNSINVDIFGSASTTGVTTVTVNGGSHDIDIFGSASTTGSSLSATISGSNNVDIFGSASTTGVSTVTVNGGSHDIDIFGSALPTGSSLNATISGSSNVDIFGSASTTGATSVTVNGGSHDIDIFGSASSIGSGLDVTISNSSIVDIFGSASASVTTVTVSSSNDIDIFGSASPTSSGLDVTISNSSNVDIFGSASTTGVSTITVKDGSSDIDIFGSASPNGSGLDVTISSSSNVDIFGSASTTGVSTITVKDGSSNIDIFGSASATLTTVIVSSSNDIDIFGSASPTGSGLDVTISGSSNIDIFGSASTTGVTTVTVNGGSNNIDIFGSASPTGSVLNATVSNSSNIDIFGSASTGVSNIAVTSSNDIDIFGSASPGTLTVTVASSTDIDIFGSASPTGSTLNATVSNSSNIDIFGSANPTGPGTITVSSSQDIDIFGSASTGTFIVVTSSSDIDIYGGYGDNVTLNNATRTRVEGGYFGSASVQGITVTVSGGSTDIGIFGTSLEDNVTVGPSSRVGVNLRGGADTVQVDGAQHFVALTDAGVDRVTIRSGFDMLIYLGTEDDQAEVIGGDLIRIIGEAGNDEFLLSGGSSLTVDGGEGNDRLLVTGGRAITIRGDAGDDVVDIYGGVGISAVGGVGNEQLRIFGSLGGALDAGKVYALLDGQDGNDVLEVRPLLSVADRGPIPIVPIATVEAPFLYAPAWMTLPLWITAPTVTTFASSIALVGGSGSNSIWLEGAQRLYGIGGDDVDTITLQAGNSSEVAGGRGADIITVRASGYDNRVFGDQDNDMINAYAGTRLGIFGEEGVDTIGFDGGQDGFARGGSADDIMEIRSGNRIVLAGEDGNDTASIRGGVSGVAAGGIGNDTLEIVGGSLGLLLGQSGNDHLIASGGTQSIVSGGDGDDQIDASNRGDDLYGDDGDDVYRILITSSLGQRIRLRELLYVDPADFEPQARGSDTIDLSAFSNSANLNLGTLGVFNDLSVGVQSVIGTQLQLILLGSLENIIGTSASDTLIGNSESNRIEGRGGDDIISGVGGDDTLEGGTGNDVIDGGSGDDLFLFATESGVPLGSDTVYEANNGGIDGLDFSGMPVGLGTLDLNNASAQSLSGGLLGLTLRQSSSNVAVAEVEEVVATSFDDTILGNSLDNRIEPKGGNDMVDGRGGSDIYVFTGRNLGSDQVIDASSGAGRDTLDFVGFDAPVAIDLALTTPQNLGELTLTLSAGDSIENVLGSSFDDIIYGNSRDNALFGAAGVDRLEGRSGNDRLVGDLPAVVLLDFDSAYRADRGDYNYSQDERNAIQLRLKAAYSAFNWTFTQYESVVPPTALPGSQAARALTADMGRSFVRIAFSEGRGGGISGDAGEVDFRNTRRRLITEVNVNPLLPTVRQLLVEQVGINYTQQQYSDMVVAFTSTVAGHELGHTAGLRHGDALGPIGSGYFAETDTTNVYPADTRVKAALETEWHLLASPASVGTPLSSAARTTFFGEREAIKMAFNDIGRTRREAASAPGSHSTRPTAEDLGSLSMLYVPNLAPSTGFVRSGQSFDVSAMAVVGDLKLLTNTAMTEVDYYRFEGIANEVVNIELLASSIRPLRGGAFDGELRIFKSDGTQLAFNDDDFEGTRDATLLDVVLPQDGTYYISVGLSAQPAIASPGGRYELFVSRFRVGPSGPVIGDTFVGGAGSDSLAGSAANDTFLATDAQVEDVDAIDGKGGYDTLNTLGLFYRYTSISIENIVAPANTPPVARASSVTTNEDAAKPFVLANFGFVDLENNIPTSITISGLALASGDTLKLSGSNVSVNQLISVANIPNLVYTPAFNANGNARSSFSFKVNDADLGTVAAVMTINVTAVNDAPTATFNIPTTSILVGTSFSVSLTNPVDPDNASGFIYAFDVGGGYGAFGNANSVSVIPSVVGPIIVKGRINDKQGGITEYTGTVNIVLATGSAYILSLSASGAVTASGNANVNLPLGLFVDSSSPSAIIASGNARINVGGTVQVVGGISKCGNAQVTKTGVPASTNDPLSSLTSPGLTGLTNYSAVSVAGNTTRTLSPGIYTSIQLSGNANVTMSPGMYIIKGGGFTVSGNAGVSGSGVTIFNAGSNYSGTTDGGNFGGISLSGNGNLNLNPPTTGAYAGILIYQSRVNTRALSISGNANVNVNGTIYAANAALTMSGNGQLDDTLIVNTLNISGNIALTQLATGSDSAGDVGGNANTLLAGDLNVYISSIGGSFSSDMLARIREAITSIDTLLVPYNVSINEVSEPALATVIINTSMTSASGTAADGVLGSYNPASNPVAITFLQGWDWYAGVDPVAIGASQYDFQTSVMHELGHALGLGHSSDVYSAMNAMLSTRTAHRVLTVDDLNIPSMPEGVEPLTAAGFVREQVQLEQVQQVLFGQSNTSAVRGLLVRDAEPSMIESRFRDQQNSKLPGYSSPRFDAFNKQIPSRQPPLGNVQPATQRKNGNLVRSIHAVRDESISATAVDAAMAEFYAATDKAE